MLLIGISVVVVAFFAGKFTIYEIDPNEQKRHEDNPNYNLKALTKRK